MSSNKVQRSHLEVETTSSDDGDLVPLRRKTKSKGGSGSASSTSSSSPSSTTATMTTRGDAIRQSKTPLMAMSIVIFFVVAAILKGQSNKPSSSTNNAGAIRASQNNNNNNNKEHHYTNPYTPSSSGDGEGVASRTKYINEQSSTSHAKLHGGWNDLDEQDDEWTCKGDYPDEDAWQTWIQHVNRLGPQASCIRKMKRPCHCRQPLDAIPRASDIWKGVVKRNQELVRSEESRIANDVPENQQLDVLLLGDSITEFWQGTKMGMTMPSLRDTHKLYLDLFRSHKSNINNLHGLALGISGDRCPQLLYRMQHGELNDRSDGFGLDPKVVWIFIGMNDYLSNACNAHVISACNIKVVEYIRKVRPDATIVINSMLPAAQSHAAWQELSQINQQLECYAERHADDGVEFFNAYEYFLTSSDGDDDEKDDDVTNSRAVNKTLLLNDAVHPSTLGYEIWGNAIVAKVKEILAAAQQQRDDDADGESSP